MYIVTVLPGENKHKNNDLDIVIRVDLFQLY